MLKKLMGRNRALRLGAGLLGASALAVGFASPAFATSSTGGDGVQSSQNYNIYQGGSNTTYLMMQALADVFNQAPGCDLAASSNTAQELDYGCPGLNGNPGTTLSTPQSVSVSGSTLNSSTTITVSNSAGFFINDAVSDSAGAVPNHTIITSVPNGTSIVVNKAATSTQSSDTISVVTTPAVGENGFTAWGNENPFNDLLIEEPAIGSGNGILELEDQGAHASGATSHGSAIGVSPLDVARSSRAPSLTSGSSAGDDKGLNFVAYAMDAVTWIHWTIAPPEGTTGTPVATPSAAVTNLTTAQLTSIYENQGCTGAHGTYTTPNWDCYGGKVAPIVVYMAQNGSGTESTWVSLLGLTGTFPFGGEDPNHVIFENQTASILANQDEANAIFFFSDGKYSAICAPNPTLCSGNAKSKIALGEINSIAVSGKTIQAQLPGSGKKVFPGDRLLFNVYSDGSNASIPESSAASLNAVSEDGFLCKPATATDVDPNTGSTYRTEINAIIKAQGFTPMPLMVENGEGISGGGYGTTASGIPAPAWSASGLSGSAYNAANESGSPWNFPTDNQDTDNAGVSGSFTGVYDAGNKNATVTASAKNPVGYCLVETTDGNSTN